VSGGERIMLTGGEGRLGTELRALIPGIMAPTEVEMDITRPELIDAALKKYQPTVVVHAAAYTNVAGAETDRAKCWAINVRGTANIVRALRGEDALATRGQDARDTHGQDARATRATFLVYISTDYVFDGTRGNYKEDDPVGPVCNYYSLTKLVGEELVRLHRPHLVLRTSFRPREWPYPVAFTDVYTSQDYVDVIAPELALAITRCREVGFDTLHVATERKSVFDLARRRRPDVKPGSKAQAKVRLPDDISLDVSRWREVKARLQGT
jgi:dTDP-4-dehydrorhamnose reductase